MRFQPSSATLPGTSNPILNWPAATAGLSAIALATAPSALKHSLRSIFIGLFPVVRSVLNLRFTRVLHPP